MENDWIENCGVMPVAGGEIVDILVENWRHEDHFGKRADHWNWEIDDCGGDITHWRLYKPEKFLEDAYNEPESIDQLEESFEAEDYKYPSTNYQPTKLAMSEKDTHISDVCAAFEALTRVIVTPDQIDVLLKLIDINKTYQGIR